MIYILAAKTTDGTIVVLSSEMKKTKLREWRKNEVFLCPRCDGSVHLKVGDVVIPHFAHQQDASCSASFSEGESTEHLQGKQQLYEFFQRIGKAVKLEPYFSALAQRPDLLVTNHSYQIPIEFQCSTIPISQLTLRTMGYESAGMTPIWLLRTPTKLKTLSQGVGIFHFSRFEKSFFTKKSPEGFVLLTYDPEFSQFHYFTSLFHIVGKQHIGMHRILSISDQIFPFARPIIPSKNELRSYWRLYLSIREQFLRTRILVNRRGINDPFLRACYELRMPPLELKKWIGIPVKSMEAFEEHVCEWQLALVYFISQRRIPVSKLTTVTLRGFVKMFDGSTEQLVLACVEYRDFLASVGIDSFNERVKVKEEQLVQQFTNTFLAKWNEN